MQVNVSTRHTEMERRDRDLVVKKLTRLGDKFLEMETAEVHFFQERNPRIADKEVCEITLTGHGHHVRVKANAPEALTATDLAIEKLENKLRKLKTKLSAHRKHRDVTKAKLWASASTDLPDDLLVDVSANGTASNGTATAVDDYDTAEVAEYMAAYTIVKSKVVENLELAPVDAAMRMDLVGHDFYFFTNSETGGPAVVYRRDDGAIGLIDVAAESQAA